MHEFYDNVRICLFRCCRPIYWLGRSLFSLSFFLIYCFVPIALFIGKSLGSSSEWRQPCFLPSVKSRLLLFAVPQEAASRRSSTLCRQRPCCRRSPRPAARAPRPSAAAADHPRRQRRRQVRPKGSGGAAAPTTWRSAPSFPRRSATRGGRRRRDDGAVTLELRRLTCIIITSDVRYVYTLITSVKAVMILPSLVC